MDNLFEELMYALKRHNKTLEDIEWVGGEDFYIDLSTFIEAAKETNYDSGYGSQQVAEDLVIVFKDKSWFSRGEYDGSEWFEYNCFPQKPQDKFNKESLSLLKAWGKWTITLADINS